MSATTNPDATLSTQRVMAFSPREIFDAFRNPDCLARWWGPNGFTNTFELFEFQSGGRWVFVMHGPDGGNYPNDSVFREIIPDSRIVIEHVCAPRFTLTITLTAQGDKTVLSWSQQFEDASVAEKLRQLCTNANEQNLDRLVSVLEKR
ncbi:MAG: SRPBCC family protein [Gemmataceae bacterium]